MALVAASVANGGVIMEPHVGAEIRDASDDLVRRIDDTEWKTAMSGTSAQALNSMMISVVERGSGTSARIAGVSVAGKTGTAQADGGAPHAWFIAFAPANDPQIAVAVLVERGGSLGNEATGGAVAAPIAARMIRRRARNMSGLPCPGATTSSGYRESSMLPGRHSAGPHDSGRDDDAGR